MKISLLIGGERGLLFLLALYRTLGTGELGAGRVREGAWGAPPGLAHLPETHLVIAGVSGPSVLLPGPLGLCNRSPGTSSGCDGHGHVQWEEARAHPELPPT